MKIINNKIDSEYMIVNIKLNFNNNDNLTYKKQYFNSIKEWIKLTLDKYIVLYNWIYFINNFNFDTIRIFIFIDPITSPNMDDNKLIFLTNNFTFADRKINIKNLSNLFNLEEFKIIIQQQCKLINQHSLSSSNESQISDLINTDYNLYDNNLDYQGYTLINNQLINNINMSRLDNSNPYSLNNIYSIGISGINKNTFISELKKINTIKYSNIYYNSKHNIYNYNLLKKIKENNEFYWVDFNQYDYANELIDNSELKYIISLL